MVRGRGRVIYENCLGLTSRIWSVVTILVLLLVLPVRAERQDALNPTDWTFRGNSALDRGDLAEALDDYSEAIRRNSSDPVPLFDRARVFERLGRTNDALADASQSVLISPLFADGFELIARLDTNAGNLAQALKAITTAIELSPKPAPLQFRLLNANILEKMHRLDDSASIYSDVLREDAENPDALYGSARIKLLEGRQDEALVLLERYKTVDTRSSEVHLIIVKLLLEMKRSQDALNWIDLHLRNDPQGLEYRAKALSLLGRSSEALELLSTSNVRSPFGDTLLGEAAMKAHKCDMARSAFLRVVQASTEPDASSWRNLGVSYLCLQDNAAALDALNRVISLNPSDVLAYCYRADAFRSLGDKEQAVRDAKMAVKLGPADPDVLMMLRIDEYQMGNHRTGSRDYAAGCGLLKADELQKRELCDQQLPRMQLR